MGDLCLWLHLIRTDAFDEQSQEGILFCKRCGAAQTQVAKFCSECGTPRDGNSASDSASLKQSPSASGNETCSNAPPFAVPNSGLPVWKQVAFTVALAFTLMAIVWVFLAFTSAPHQARISASTSEVDQVPGVGSNLAWYPSNFRAWADDDTVAWRWLQDGEFNCESSDSSCWGVEVLSQFGCPDGIYAELSIVDEFGSAIAWTNDALGALAMEQKGKLIFETFEVNAQAATLSELHCY